MVLDRRKLPDSKSQIFSPMFPSGTVRLHVFHLYSRSMFSSFLHSVQLWSKHTFFARGCPALVSSLPHRKEVFLFLIKMPPAWLDRVPLCGQPYPDWSVLLDSESPHTRRQGDRAAVCWRPPRTARLVPTASWGWGWVSKDLACPARGREAQDV